MYFLCYCRKLINRLSVHLLTLTLIFGVFFIIGGARAAEQQITVDIADQTFPVISGDKIVWQDYRNGNADVYLYDLATSTETRITSAGAYQWKPSVSGDRVVWEDYRNANYDIYMYDLSTSTETQITTDPGTQGAPDISGDIIVWQDFRNSNYDIYMYDLSTGVETQVTTATTNQMYPDISGDKIVWMEFANYNWDIHMYNITTGVETQLTTDVSNQLYPEVSGDKVVWVDLRNGNYDVYMYDVTTGAETAITADPVNQLYPTISGDKIVWMEYSTSWNVFMYDLGTGAQTQLSADSSDQWKPSISGDKVVWYDYRNGNYDVYMYFTDVPNTPPVALLQESFLEVPIFSEVLLDATASFDEDGDLLGFDWSFASEPAGSTAVITEPSEGLATFTPDALGTYSVELLVSDGTDVSGPLSVEVQVITIEEAASDTLFDTGAGISDLQALDPGAFVTPGTADRMLVKIDKILREIEKGNYDLAVFKLEEMIVRVDGCALRGEPDDGTGGFTKDDIVDCAAQAEVYDALMYAKELVESLL